MVDFSAAEEAGMGLRLPVSAQLASTGIDTLLVFGAASSLAAGEASKQLAALLDSHHYTDGLSFLRPGAASNNTEGARSTLAAHDADARQSFATETGGLTGIMDVDSNARQLGSALGFSPARVPEVLGRIPEAMARHALNCRSMNTALWSGTWGYFLSNMIGFSGTGLTAEGLAWARKHYIDNVRAAGPFAGIRCGRQPYGVLPVTSLDLWQPPSSDAPEQAFEGWLRTLLIKLRDQFWRTGLAGVPRVGSTADPAADLISVMRTDAQSSSYETRALLGMHYLAHLRVFVLEDLLASSWVAKQDEITRAPLLALGFPWRPRLGRATYEDHLWRVKVPLISGRRDFLECIPLAQLHCRPARRAFNCKHSRRSPAKR